MFKLYKRLLSYIPEKSLNVYLSIVCSTLHGILNGLSYYLIYKFFYEVLILNSPDGAKSYALKILFMLLLSQTIYFAGLWLSHFAAFRLETALKYKGAKGIINSSFKFFDTHSSGATRKIIDDNAEETHMMVAHLIPDNTSAIINPIMLIAISFVINLRVGIAILILTILNGFILKKFTYEAEFMKLYQKALERMGNETVEYIRGMQVIKIFKTNIFSFKRLYDAIIDYSDMAYKYCMSCKTGYLIFKLLFFAIACFVIPIFLVFFKSDFNTTQNVLNLIMIMFISGSLFVSSFKIMHIGMFFGMAQNSLDKLENAYNETQTDKIDFGKEEKFNSYDIEFDNVSFGYNDKLILENLSFKLDENKSYALVGESGSGKSTIAKLISGFYKLNSGEIKIGGKNINSYTEEAVMKNISFVFQNAKLFKDSIYNNLLVAKADATREEVLEALKNANCNDILDKFPERENTIIGSKGVYLSGGEKQRIAIARAILKNSPIIIMDEASAAIDADNEHEIQKAFKYLMKNKTVIMIAHRLSSIADVDEVLVIDKGKIIERGKHAELMTKDSQYQKIQNLYNKSNEWRLSYE